MKKIGGADGADFADTVATALARTANSRLDMKGHCSVWKTDLHGATSLVSSGPNLVTRDGIDHIIQQIYVNRSSGTRGANFLALSSATSNISVTDTILQNEIRGDGLGRTDIAAAGGVTHTDNTNAVTISHVFTAAAAIPRVQQAGLFISSSSSLPIHKYRFSSPTALATNERLTVSWNVTIT